MIHHRVLTHSSRADVQKHSVESEVTSTSKILKEVRTMAKRHELQRSQINLSREVRMRNWDIKNSPHFSLSTETKGPSRTGGLLLVGVRSARFFISDKKPAPSKTNAINRHRMWKKRLMSIYTISHHLGQLNDIGNLYGKIWHVIYTQSGVG